MVSLEDIAEGVINGETAKVKELIKNGLEEGISAHELLHKGLVSAMSLVGHRFENKEIFLPEVLLSARAMLGGMELLEPILARAGAKPMAKVTLGTVKGDIHTIGKTLVGIMMKGAGFQVTDLGIDVPPEKFVEAARGGAQILGLSALTGTTMLNMKPTIEALEAAGLRHKVKVMVGGAIVTQAFANRVGADGYAPDASSAVRKARELLGIPD